MANKKYIIMFAGVVGSSKTPISNFLSIHLNLPIHNNDSIRSEVIEDVGQLDQKEYLKRRDERLKYALYTNRSFILDASIDRYWKEYRDKIKKLKYKVFIISIDLGKKFLKELHTNKQYDRSINHLDKLIKDHKKFLAKFEKDVNLHITDKNFANRLTLSLDKAQRWIKRI